MCIGIALMRSSEFSPSRACHRASHRRSCFSFPARLQLQRLTQKASRFRKGLTPSRLGSVRHGSEWRVPMTPNLAINRTRRFMSNFGHIGAPRRFTLIVRRRNGRVRTESNEDILSGLLVFDGAGNVSRKQSSSRGGQTGHMIRMDDRSMVVRSFSLGVKIGQCVPTHSKRSARPTTDAKYAGHHVSRRYRRRKSVSRPE